MKKIHPAVTFGGIAVLSFILSVVLYATINGIPLSEIPTEWTWMVDRWFSPESLFFLLFFGMIGVLSIFVYIYNTALTISYEKYKCKGKWDKKKKICLE